MKNRWKRGVALLCALACMIGFAVPAWAYTALDLTRKTSLTLIYGEPKAIPGARFDLYRVADVSEDFRYTLSGDFQDYPVNLNGLDSEGWRAAAETLSAYARRDAEPMAHGTTDDQGRLRFGDLDVGLYLVVGHRLAIGRYSYIPEPMLVQLPGLDGEEQWVYDLTALPKYEEDYEPPTPGEEDDTVTRKVLKVWRDGGRTDRPKEIVVQLLRNGEVYSTETLNEENLWRHTWTDLDDDDVWQVIEYDVPDGYQVSVSREGITFQMTNTYDDDEPDDPDEPDEPDDPDEPGDPREPREPDKPEIPEIPEIPEKPQDPKLPQTGVLWWPVPLLACGGAALFLMGLLRRRRKEQDEA